MTTTVPAILKYLSDSSNYNIDQNVETPVRAKKRRLDHLSWEEKLQRKKLKNRVAAQTSRDRKKAKMDQMEKAIQELFTKNETLLAECDSLKKLNQRLTAENAELRLRAQCCHVCTTPSYQSRSVECEAVDGGPAESPSPLRPQGAPATHSAAALVSRMRSMNWQQHSSNKEKDLLELDVDVASLEQLTQSLLQDIARDLEAASEKADLQEFRDSEETCTREVVGSSPEQLESSRGEVLNEEEPLIKDISQYLLLHHNYSAKPPKEKKNRKSARNGTICKKEKTKVKPILPKIDETVCSVQIPTLNIEDTDNIIYLEEVDNITVVIDDSDTLSQDENVLTIPSLSPRSVSSSDCGYESLGSPESFSPTEDIWDSDVSELFPNLI